MLCPGRFILVESVCPKMKQFGLLCGICFESRSLRWQPEIEEMHESMPKNYRKMSAKLRGAHCLLSESESESARLLKNWARARFSWILSFAIFLANKVMLIANDYFDLNPLKWKVEKIGKYFFNNDFVYMTARKDDTNSIEWIPYYLD